MRPKYNFNHYAFTLVEIVIATVILAIAVLGVMSAFISGTKLVAASKYRLQAINYAQQILENLRQEVRADTWDSGNLRLTSGSPIDCLGTNPLASFGGTCTYTVNYVDLNGNGSGDFGEPRRVDVSVNWTAP